MNIFCKCYKAKLEQPLVLSSRSSGGLSPNPHPPSLPPRSLSSRPPSAFFVPANCKIRPYLNPISTDMIMKYQYLLYYTLLMSSKDCNPLPPTPLPGTLTVGMCYGNVLQNQSRSTQTINNSEYSKDGEQKPTLTSVPLLPLT